MSKRLRITAALKGQNGIGLRAKSLHDRVQKLLKHATDVGILVTLFVAPLFLGGRHDMGRLVLVSTICFTVACWTLRKLLRKHAQWHWTGLEWFAAFSIGILILQLTPLPIPILEFLAPNVQELLPTWDSQSESSASLGSWNQLSLTPVLTRGALVMLISYWLLFFVIADHLRNLADIQRTLKWIGLAAISMALIGIGQRFFGNGKFLWVYEHPSRNTLTAVNGAFTNQNHFAHFLALGIAPLILWTRSKWTDVATDEGKKRRNERAGTPGSQLPGILLVLGLCVIVFAGLLSFSRGGVTIVFLTSLIGVFGLAWIGMMDRKAVVGVALAGGIITASIFIFGLNPLVDELETIDQAQTFSELLSVRLDLWVAMLSAVMDFPLFGTGASSHREVYPTFFDHSGNSQFSHGENGYVQIALETGVAGVLVLSTMIGKLSYSSVRWLLRSKDKSATACMVVTVAGLLASVLHSMVDFVWYIPACVTLTVVLLALFCRISQLNSQNCVETTQFVPPYPLAVLVGVGAMILCGTLVDQRVGPGMASTSWDKYFALSRHTGIEERREFTAKDSEGLANLASEFRLREMRRYLLDTLRWDPTNSRAMLRLASIDLRQFRQQQARLFASMSFDQIVNVAENSEFADENSKHAWLDKVLGERRRLLRRASLLSQQSLRLSPLEGRGYILLAESGQLYGWGGQRRKALFDQARKVRPFDELVLYKSGIEKVQAGDIDSAIDYWQAAFVRSPDIRNLAIESLVPIYSSEQLAELLGHDWESLYRLFTRYRNLELQEDATFIAKPLANALEIAALDNSGGRAAELMSRAGDVYAHLNKIPDSVRCLRKSTLLSPNNFGYRNALARRLVQAEQFDEAVTEYKWCRRRQPKNEAVETELEAAYKLSVVRRQAAADKPKQDRTARSPGSNPAKRR